jgi:hypothetical protein
MAKGEQLLNALDHPVFFAIVMTIVVFSLAAVFSWGFKAANLPGPAAIFGG